jgi:hypothetical protein
VKAKLCAAVPRALALPVDFVDHPHRRREEARAAAEDVEQGALLGHGAHAVEEASRHGEVGQAVAVDVAHHGHRVGEGAAGHRLAPGAGKTSRSDERQADAAACEHEGAAAPGCEHDVVEAVAVEVADADAAVEAPLTRAHLRDRHRPRGAAERAARGAAGQQVDVAGGEDERVGEAVAVDIAGGGDVSAEAGLARRRG